MEITTIMKKHIIYLNKQARYWDDGLPVGNGRLGAMVMGKTDEETIFINEETLWYGKDRDRKNPDTLKYLDKIRELLFAGEVQKAQFLAKMAMTSAPKYMNPYQPAGDMRICIYDHKYPVTDYARWLDLDEATAHVRYTMRGTTYTREHFVSHKYQVLCIRLTMEKKADTPEEKGLSLCVNMSRKPFEENTESLGPGTVCNYGQCGPDGVNYFTGIRLAARGGEIDSIGDFAYVRDAEEVWIYLASGTDYQDSDYREHCLERLDQAAQAGYEEIRKEHERQYHQLSDRMELRLGDWELPKKPMNEILEDVKAGKEENLNFLTEMLFTYARYLMISSSYDCLMPSNLQGLWNGEYAPPWQCEFTININTEMNYWMAEKCGLPECHLPLFEQLKRMVPRGQKTAKALYGCQGFCAHHNTNIWANTDPEGIFDASPFWPMGGAWLSLHLFEHYLYTLDREFLQKEALPVMREAVRFYEDYLCESPDGYLVTGPSLSPENTYLSKIGAKGALCMGPAMDTQILRTLFTDYLKTCEILGLEGEEDSKRTAGMLEKLPPTGITSDGRIMEWQEEYEETEPGHRHISHLFALHPGSEITCENKELFAAAEKTLRERLSHGGGHTGWSRAWITCFYARLRKGEEVYQSIRTMLSTCIKINLLDTHPPFQIDGNFGVAEAILESLAQSHAGCLDFLPALPEGWPEGSVRGMILRGAVRADFSWKDGKLTQLYLTAREDTQVEIRMGKIRKSAELKQGARTCIDVGDSCL